MCQVVCSLTQNRPKCRNPFVQNKHYDELYEQITSRHPPNSLFQRSSSTGPVWQRRTLQNQVTPFTQNPPSVEIPRITIQNPPSDEILGITIPNTPGYRKQQAESISKFRLAVRLSPRCMISRLALALYRWKKAQARKLKLPERFSLSCVTSFLVQTVNECKKTQQTSDLEPPERLSP